jgi:RHS repeat-associated protein
VYNLSYDAENRLTTVSGAATATFVYDGDGNRVKETNVYKNLAKGIVVSGSTGMTHPDVVANGDTQADSGTSASREFAYSNTTGLQYVKIDLGATFPVNKVIVWHYNGDGRTYHNTKTQVSADGINWTTVFDSATQGEYAETLAGKTHTFAQQSVRYVRDYLNGSTANSGNHWTEIEVWGTTTTAYVGDYFEWNGSAPTMTRYYYSGETRAAVRNSNGTGTNGLVYLLGDHLGSTSITSDPVDGDKLSELRFKGWGETRYSLTSAPTDRRFTGQIEEAGIGLYFYNARFYDSALGRFTSADTLIPGARDVQAWDRYAYVRNNPVNYTDPTGHIEACEENCKEQKYLEKLYNKLGAINFMKQSIKDKHGIVMMDSDTMKWSKNNLYAASTALYMINNKLNGNLKTMVGGSTFTITTGGNQYYGWTGSAGVTYHVASSSTSIPTINFLHETGHLLDSIPATENVFSDQVPATPTWVKDGYVDREILGGKYNEPVQALPMNEPNQPGEYWADAFANYVAGNIDLMQSAGRDMHDFVSAALAPYIGH